jgi:hypothetical protein
LENRQELKPEKQQQRTLFVKFFFHIALDEWAAESLARVARSLTDIADNDRERHCFVWAGVRPQPENADYWQQRFPSWDGKLAIPVLDQESLTLDRQRLGGQVRDLLQSDDFRHTIDKLLYELPAKSLGRNVTAEPIIVLAGALANPATSALLIGILAGFARLKNMGLYQHPLHAVCDAGAAGGQIEGGTEKVRALIARSLLDIEDFFKGAAPLEEAAAPVYCVGERQIEGLASGRDEQVALGAMTIIGLTRSILLDHQSTNDLMQDPFLFQIDSSGIRQANDQYDPAAPFAVVGAYSVACAREQLARLLAARYCSQAFSALVRQQDLDTLEKCSLLEIPHHLRPVVEEAESRALQSVWDRVAERFKIAWNDTKEKVRTQEWFDFERIQLLYSSIFKNRDWERLLGIFGEARLKAIPLDTWNGAIDELVETVERGFVPRRVNQVSHTTRRVLQVILSAIDDSSAWIFSSSMRPPVGFEPHRVAQAFLGRIRNRLLDAQKNLDASLAIQTALDAGRRDRRKRAGELRSAFEKSLSEVPSPAAVLLRYLPAFALPVGLFVALPIGLGFLDPPVWRLAAGAVLGAAVVTYLYARYVDSVKRRLLGSFREWFEQYKLALEEEDDQRRRLAYQGLLDAMLRLLEWYFNGEKKVATAPLIEGETLRRQEVVSAFHRYLQDAAAAYGDLATQFLDNLQHSHLETLLPEISASRLDLLEVEYARLFVRDAGRVDDVALQDFAEELFSRAEGHPEAEGELAGLLPFAAASEEVWRRSFLMPNGVSLLDQTIRDASSGWRFLETVSRFVLERLAASSSLDQRLGEYLQGEGGKALSATDLFVRYSNLAVPSMESTGAKTSPTPYVVAADPSDSLARNLGWANSLGAGQMSLHLQLQLWVSAESLIFFPNSKAPSTALGKAWKAHQEKPWPDPALVPMKL